MHDALQAILKHAKRLSDLSRKDRRAILPHGSLRKLENTTDERLEWKENREVEVMQQWMRWQGVAKARSRKDIIDQMERV